MKLSLLTQLKNAHIKQPIDFDFGGVRFAFTAHIKLVTQSELDALTANNSHDADIVRTLLIDWDAFVDNKKDVPFSDAVLDELLAYGGIAGRLAVECVNAQYRVQEKN